jgi:hypothetical protein
MANYNSTVGTFELTSPYQQAFTFTGLLFRCIPNSSQTPLAANFALTAGGRWNPAGSFAVLYTCASVEVARSFVNARAQKYGVPWNERPREEQPDLLVLNLNATFTDVATDSGLQRYGLPVSYPVGYQLESSYVITQPIGQAIFNSGASGLVARSATSSSWTGSIPQWAEVAIFVDHSDSPQVVDRVPYADWYAYE